MWVFVSAFTLGSHLELQGREKSRGKTDAIYLLSCGGLGGGVCFGFFMKVDSVVLK